MPKNNKNRNWFNMPPRMPDKCIDHDIRVCLEHIGKTQLKEQKRHGFEELPCVTEEQIRKYTGIPVPESMRNYWQQAEVLGYVEIFGGQAYALTSHGFNLILPTEISANSSKWDKNKKNRESWRISRMIRATRRAIKQSDFPDGEKFYLREI